MQSSLLASPISPQSQPPTDEQVRRRRCKISVRAREAERAKGKEEGKGKKGGEGTNLWLSLGSSRSSTASSGTSGSSRHGNFGNVEFGLHPAIPHGEAEEGAKGRGKQNADSSETSSSSF
jgi:hypothetical protein